MVLDVAGLAFWSSNYNPDGAPDDAVWNGYTQSQLASVAKLVNIKAEDHISERIYIRISQWADHIVPGDNTLPLNYYSTYKLIRELDLRVEKINACKKDCMLYWNDDINLEYCKFCGEARYKPMSERNPNCKKTMYVILRYLPLIPHLQRLYASKAFAEQMM
ncbi:UNVERIFIED_CONTAM: hypothetical protein Sradi_3639200 [Sesamum radiatum]|uniref:Uncharacterized protein n=1 Tax=Sesamum radiatum TaxID=300843 RepID=A0AAW2QHW8_SESRA